MMEKMKQVFSIFTLVTTLVVMATASYVSIFYDFNTTVSIHILWQILGVSFVSSFGILIYPKWELTKKQMIIYKMLHYLYTNIVVLVCGFYFHWFTIQSISMVCGMLLLIAIIFVTVSIIMTRKDKKLADSLNKILERYQEKK
ncbi:MAG TPA: DUF3021 family protein [Lachnospiraceae bacterium]|nr:DUF3021 family protein [Lachnospiraceae bacterium]